MTSTIYESSPQPFAPVAEAENEQRARTLIDQSVEDANSAGGTISRETARLIAATIHHGPTTALGRFAATGTLHPLAATVELWDSSIHELPTAWWRALDLYLSEEVA